MSAATTSAAMPSAREKPVSSTTAPAIGGRDEGEQVGEHVLEGALHVQAAALGAGEHHRGGEVHDDAGQRDDEHDAALDVGRVERAAGCPPP